MKGVWAASVKTNTVNYLFDEYCDFTILQWTSPESFISVSHRNGSSRNLRFTSVKTGDSIQLLPDDMQIIDHYAVAVNPVSGATAYSGVSTNTLADRKFGFFIVSPQDSKPLFVQEEYYLNISWMSGIQRFIGHGDIGCGGVALFSMSGEKKCLYENYFDNLTQKNNTDIHYALYSNVSPDGDRLLILNDEGVYLYDKNLVRSDVLEPGGITPSTSWGHAVWQPDSQGLVIQAKDHIYYVDANTNIANMLIHSVEDNFSYSTWNNNSQDLFIQVNRELYHYNIAFNELQMISENAGWFSYTWVGLP